MNSVRTIILLILLPFSGIAQVQPDLVYSANKYLLSSKGPSGELIITTGRIVRAIAVSHPKSLEVANLWVNYSVAISITTDREGSSTARISFKNLHLTGDIDYKGFDIIDYIFPSCVSFKLVSSDAGKVNPVITSVKQARVNSGDCIVSVSLGKNIKEVPAIEKLCFFHSEVDYEKAISQIKLIERYYTATWLMKRIENLMDSLQSKQLKNPSAFISSTVEIALLNDWISRQRFDKYSFFQKVDSLMFTKKMQDNRLLNKKIQQKFVKTNAITWTDLSVSATLFSEKLAAYFDVGSTDLNRSVYLTQMAGSSMTNIGYKSLLDFAEIYNAAHPLHKISQREIVTFSALIESAMIRHAAKLVEKDQYSDALNMLNTSDKYSLLLVVQQSPFEKTLTHNLCQRLYNYNLDIAMMAIKSNVARVSTDYFRKALSLKSQYPDMVRSDPRERYIAEITCKNIIQTSDQCYKIKDITSALIGYDEVIKIADSSNLKVPYEIARTRIQTISGRPSEYRPWDERGLPIGKNNADVAKQNYATNMAGNTLGLKNQTSLIAGKRKLNPGAPKNGIIERDSSLFRVTIPIIEIDTSSNESIQSLANSLAQSSDLFEENNIESIYEQSLREKLMWYEKNIQLKIKAGSADSSFMMLKVADSLQEILSKKGDNGFLVDLQSLRISYNNLICAQQKAGYDKDFEKIKLVLSQNDFLQARDRLKLLLNKPLNAECPIDKSVATQLLGTLEAPILFKRMKNHLDSLKLNQEPEVIIEAFNKANEYYRLNSLEKWRLEVPDVISALQFRKEVSFLLKATQQFADNHQPAYALELLKSIAELDSKPDKLQVLQKRVGEMLASGDYSSDRGLSDKLIRYGLDERWFSTLINAYKKQWKLLSK